MSATLDKNLQDDTMSFGKAVSISVGDIKQVDSYRTTCPTHAEHSLEFYSLILARENTERFHRRLCYCRECTQWYSVPLLASEEIALKVHENAYERNQNS